MDNYYTYAYLREDGSPYYIGKGKGRRAWSGRHRIHLPADTARIVILAEGLSDDTAKSMEKELIAKYGRKDLGTGILQNQTDGGDGNCLKGAKNGMYGRTHTPETREKIKAARATQIMKPCSAEQKLFLSEKFKGRKKPAGCPEFHTEETKAKIAAAHLGKPKKKGYTQSEEQKQKKLESFRATMAAKKQVNQSNAG
jgi:hypothetical protein